MEITTNATHFKCQCTSGIVILQMQLFIFGLMYTVRHLALGTCLHTKFFLSCINLILTITDRSPFLISSIDSIKKCLVWRSARRQRALVEYWKVAHWSFFRMRIIFTVTIYNREKCLKIFGNAISKTDAKALRIAKLRVILLI